MRRWLVLFDDGHGRKHRAVDNAYNLSIANSYIIISTHFRDNPNIGIEAVIEIDPTKEPVIGFWDH